MTQVERLVGALKPLVLEDEKDKAPVKTTAEVPAPGTAEPKAEVPAEKEADLEKTGSDPFQRRINHVLGIGAGIRDVRSYTRQF